MHKETKTPNKANEFLLDVCPTTDELVFTIYDITAFLPHWQGYQRKQILGNLRFTIQGNTYTIFILDWWQCLTQELATKIAKEWYLGNTTYHRLD